MARWIALRRRRLIAQHAVAEQIRIGLQRRLISDALGSVGPA